MFLMTCLYIDAAHYDQLDTEVVASRFILQSITFKTFVKRSYNVMLFDPSCTLYSIPLRSVFSLY